MNETPHTIHGRMLEGAHLAGYSFERARQQLDRLVENERWRELGFKDGSEFVRSVRAAFAGLDIPAEERASLARKLAPIATHRAIADMVGVGHQTIGRDLNDGPNGPPNEEESAEEPAVNTGDGPDGPPGLSGRDVAALAKQKSAREQKDAERQERRKENAALVSVAPSIETLEGEFSTIVIDPPWAWEDEGDHEQLGRGRHTYSAMTFEELLDFPVGNVAAANAHMYLWITNRSLPKGFALLERWGFRYVTCLTWCKPSFGMGNYFRGQTEQVLFGVRGSLPLLRKDVGTWFAADRGAKNHSTKPNEFFELIETCSPAPRVELFARALRTGWTVWGAEAANAQ